MLDARMQEQMLIDEILYHWKRIFESMKKLSESRKNVENC
jgi:hypothetical protein